MKGSRDIAKSLKISFGSSFVSLCAFGSKLAVSIPSIHLSNEKNRTRLSLPVLKFKCTQILRTYRQTDARTGIFLFSSWSRIYRPVNTYLDYFSNFTPYDIFLTKLSIPFFHIGNRYENGVSKAILKEPSRGWKCATSDRLKL